MNYILISVIIICLFIIYKLKQRINTEKITALDNLGKPMELKDAGKKLYYSEGKKFCVIAFVPCRDYKNATEALEMVSGVGFIIHPNYPSNPLYVKMLFHWREAPDTFPDRKIEYEIKQDARSGYYYLGVIY